MVEQDRARGRTAAWRPWVAPWVAAGRRPALAWSDGLSDFARRVVERIRAWIAVEGGPGRLVPWLAIAFGCGVAIYFAIDREPAPWAAGLLLAAAVAAAVLSRHRPFAFPLAMGAAALAAGLATATAKRVIIAYPVLSAALWNVDIAGFVEVREERERARTASWCEWSASPLRGLRSRWNACGFRCARAPRRRWERLSSSRRDCLLRSNLYARAATTSRATCTSIVSARPVSCSAVSATPRCRMLRASGCGTPRWSTECVRRSTSASARSCLATRAPSLRP